MTAVDPLMNKYRNPILHHQGKSAYPGKYQVTNEALGHYNIARDMFGTTTIKNPDGTTFVIKDMQYRLADGSIGMNILPVNDHGAVVGPNGEKLFGSVLVDEMLRREMGLSPSDAIYAPIYYIHPELNSGEFSRLVLGDKSENGITHWGTYLGNGRTSNSPALYHNRVWSVTGEPDTNFGYPANVAILSMEGVSQAMLNKNLVLVDNFLNYGVRFPQDYKNSQFKPVDINTALMFYRDWILEKNYLKTETPWFTYCAVHKTLVAYVALNLPHNLNSFKEIYGDEEGEQFFLEFQKNHFQLLGVDFTQAQETDFEPLWKKLNLTREQIRPLTLDEYKAYDEARRTQRLDQLKGFKPLPPDVGTPWAPHMMSDALYELIQPYCDFLDSGAIVMSATIIGFSKPVMQRTGISSIEYLMGAVPIIQLAMEAHAKLYAAEIPCAQYQDSAYYKETCQSLYLAFGGSESGVGAVGQESHAEINQDKLFEGLQDLDSKDWEPRLLTWFCMSRVRENWSSIIHGGVQPMEVVYVGFMGSIQGELVRARNMVVTDPRGIQYNAPPSTPHGIGIGLFPVSEYVSIRIVATVMDHSELELKAN
jgi:hypothetical protein